MSPHLLVVDAPAAVFAPLLEALHEAGMRAGWLELTPPQSLPESLEEAADGGVLRAVSVGGGRSVAVKPMRGAPVLRDLLREHFRGTAVVLVHGDLAAQGTEAPRLERDGEGWRLQFADGTRLSWSTAELVAALRRPRLGRPRSGRPGSGRPGSGR